MFAKAFAKDEARFVGLLENPAQLEKRLVTLRRARLTGSLTGVFCAGVAMLVMSIDLFKSDSGRTSLPPPFLYLLMLSGIQGASANHAASEIRTLLMFKKLRNLEQATQKSL